METATSNPLNKPIFIFLVAGLLSTIFSLNPYHSQSIFFEVYLPYMLLFWMGVSLVRGTVPSRDLLIGAFLVSGAIFGIGGVWDYFHLHPGRLYSVFGKFILMFHTYLLYFIPFSFALVLFAKKKWLKIGGLVNLILLLPCLIWQQSRAAWVAVPLSLLFISLFKNKKLPLILLTIFIIGFFLLPPATLKRAETTFEPLRGGARIEMWQTAGAIFEDFPVFGAGIGMYEKLLYEYGIVKNLGHLHAHNTFLEVTSEMGLVGLLAFLWIFVVFFKKFRNSRLQRFGDSPHSGTVPSMPSAILLGLSGVVVATLIFAFSSSIITVAGEEAAMFWFLFGMGAGKLSNSS